MLVLTRKCGEEIVIGDGIHIKVLATSGGRVRIGITAPRNVTVHRSELELSIDVPRTGHEQNRQLRSA